MAWPAPLPPQASLSPSTSGTCVTAISQSVGQSIILSVSQSVSQPVSQSASQSVSQSANQSVSQSVSQSASQPVSQSASQTNHVETSPEQREGSCNSILSHSLLARDVRIGMVYCWLSGARPQPRQQLEPNRLFMSVIFPQVPSLGKNQTNRHCGNPGSSFRVDSDHREPLGQT